MSVLHRTGSLLALAATLLFGESLAALEPAIDIHETRLLYSSEEKLRFSIAEFLEEHAEHLTPYEEAISHWSGFSSISPRVALALLEAEYGLVSQGSASLSEALADSPSLDLGNLVRDDLIEISRHYYREKATNTVAATEALREILQSKGLAVEQFTDSYLRLFPQQPPLARQATEQSLVPEGSLPPRSLLQLPFPIGETWYNGGTHNSFGVDYPPYSSLDLVKNLGLDWGDSTNSHWIAASSPGVARVYSSCSLEVVGADGWSTFYYHLEGIIVDDGEVISRNQPLANYANDLGQALCDGGFSTGPHVHYSLRTDRGEYVDLQDVRLSDYRVEVGRFSYDTDCQYFWLERDGVKHCAWTARFNDGRGVSRDYSLEVDKRGTGDGVVYGPSIACGDVSSPTCSQMAAQGTSIELDPQALGQAQFTGWSGHSDCNDGLVTLNSDRSCTAHFELFRQLSVSLLGAGSGDVTSSPPGVQCGGNCAADFINGTSVRLAAVPEVHSQFEGWSGDSDCKDGELLMNSGVSCQATFAPCELDSTVDLPPTVENGTAVHEACNFLTADSFVVSGPNANVTFKAGNRVALGNGFKVGEGAVFSVEIGPQVP